LEEASEDASHETIILEASSLKFGGRFARNDHFGRFFSEIWKKPRAVVWWCLGGGVMFLWWCVCGGVFVLVWWCVCVVVFLWWCFCGGVLVVV